MNTGRECLQNLSKYTEQEEKDAFEIEENNVPGNRAYPYT